MTVCFFFSSRRRHTRCSRDWSSDVCSSDLTFTAWLNWWPARRFSGCWRKASWVGAGGAVTSRARSEERREGKSVDLGGRRIIKKKKKRVHERVGIYVRDHHHAEAAGEAEGN